jgi:uncharacterized protein (DUF3084 family)
MNKISLKSLIVLFVICFFGLSIFGGIAEAKKEKEDKEYWCKKAAQHRKKIEKAQEEIKEAEKKLSETENIGLQDAKKKKNHKQAQKNLDRAKKQLKDSEKELRELEDEAHRKGIPPGWLRCQFEW